MAEITWQQNHKDWIRTDTDMDALQGLTELNIEEMKLGDIMNAQAFQSLMDDFFVLTGVPVGILDMHGNVLVAKGWQDICVKFHRVNPEACRNCMESDSELTEGIKPGEFRQYRCKNHMWDIATPIWIGGKRMGHIFLGQLIYDDEEIDRELFRKQAQRYGFDEDAYLEALDRVPRFSHLIVDTAMRFYSKLAVILSQMSYSNFQFRSSLEVLSKSLSFQQALMNAVPSPIFYKDIQGKYLGGNREFQNYIGKLPEEYIGKTVYEVFPAELADIYHHADSALVASKGTQNYEASVTYADGTPHAVIFNKALFNDAQGETAGIIGVITDISERKQTEEALQKSESKLSALFSAMTEMVVLHELVFDGDGNPLDYRITDCNKAFSDITGISKEKAVGRLATEVYGLGTAPYLDIYSQVAISGNAHEYTTYFPPMDKHFSISVVSPGPNQFATITTDITGVLRIQQALESKNEELENYLYIASHDLRSPLVNVQGFSQRLQKQARAIVALLDGVELPPEKRMELENITQEGIPRTLDFIQSSVSKMDTLLNGILQISRTGRTVMTIRRIDMNALMETIIRGCDHQLSELGASITCGVLPECYGDEHLLNQVFSNIIGNAIKYRNPDRTLVIGITGNQEFNRVIYSIQDNGVGIAERHMDKIWNVFFRVDASLEDAGEGLGLSIVKRIVDKHKGRVWAESRLDQGTTFHIELQSVGFDA